MADEALRQRIRATEAEIKAFSLSLDRFLSQNLNRMLKKLKGGDISDREAVRVLGQLETVLSDAGLQDLVDNIRDTYKKEFRAIERDFSRLGVEDPFSEADLRTVESLVTFDTSRVSERVSTYITDIRSTMMRSIIAGEAVSYSDLHETLGGRLVSNMETELNTSLQAFSRSITYSKAVDLGFDLFVYLGPDDSITRPFCEHVLDRKPPIYTSAEIAKMDNKQSLPVAQYGGGYNCRHQWRPISEEEAIKRGWKDD